jgi:hypothetical protein
LAVRYFASVAWTSWGYVSLSSVCKQRVGRMRGRGREYAMRGQEGGKQGKGKDGEEKTQKRRTHLVLALPLIALLLRGLELPLTLVRSHVHPAQVLSGGSELIIIYRVQTRR